MNTGIRRRYLPPSFAALLGIFIASTFVLSTCRAQGTAFTYQGRLNDGSDLATGTNYGMFFYLYDAPSGGNYINSLRINSVSVSNGLFSVPLDFGNVFDGSPRWIEINVQKNGGSFVTLTPRQQILSSPYAVVAASANNLLGTLPASQISGTVAASQLPAGVVTNNATQLSLNGQFAGVFYGDGSSLNYLPANNLFYATNVSVLNGVVIDAAGMYQTFVTNSSYSIQGFANLKAPQSVFSQTISNASSQPITVNGPAGAFYFGGSSSSVVTIPAGEEAIWSFWVQTNVRTNICNVVQQ